MQKMKSIRNYSILWSFRIKISVYNLKIHALLFYKNSPLYIFIIINFIVNIIINIIIIVVIIVMNAIIFFVFMLLV